MLPGIIAKGFPQGMTADTAGKLAVIGCRFDDAERLDTGNRKIFVAVTKDKILGLDFFFLLKNKISAVLLQGIENALIQENTGLFPGFLLRDGNVVTVMPLDEVVYVSPAQFQNVGNPQGSV